MKPLYKAVVKAKRYAAVKEGEAYYKAQDELNQRLRDLLYSEELKTLTKGQLVEVIALCSTHRPLAPHTILIYFAELAK